ncbi:MAG: YibE/F family protein [bacterium]|nr:YibE/F family protein [bacterium]
MRLTVRALFSVWSLVFVFVACLTAAPLFAQEQTAIEGSAQDVYYKARVSVVVESDVFIQKVRVTILDGDEKGNVVEAENNLTSSVQSQQKLNVDDSVVVVKTNRPNGITYAVVEHYRITQLIIILALFIVLVLVLGRGMGFMSLLGLAFSIGVLGVYIIPNIFSGHDPLMTSVTGALMIIVVSLYLAHGFNRRTSIALLSSLLTLCVAVLCAVLFVSFTKLLGMGSESTLFIQLNQAQSIDLRGLLLGGIIIGTLGVLDDVTMGQTAAVYEIHKANSALDVSELYIRGLSVGKEHIASLVNTLALAYAGVSLPLFLLFSMNVSQPFWVILNGQEIAEEIVRTLVGSIALILAVPISTFLAAVFLSRASDQKHVKFH